VALARAISKRPGVFLMDEPLSSLDARLRTQMRGELLRIHRKLGATFVYITHDQTEAMTMGDSIAVMNEGALIQRGTPDEIYSDPADIFTAQFIGDPGMNILDMSGGISLGFRASKAILERPEGFDGLSVKAAVRTREHLGEIYNYRMSAASGDIEVRNENFLETGQNIVIYVRRENLYLFGSGSRRLPPEACPSGELTV
jgi:sn-glycerol 3-phosphate transport system ATP-binding protein